MGEREETRGVDHLISILVCAMSDLIISSNLSVDVMFEGSSPPVTRLTSPTTTPLPSACAASALGPAVVRGGGRLDGREGGEAV